MSEFVIERRLAALMVVRFGTQVLLVRHPSEKGGTTFPGGAVEAGENPLDAAIRETREETGVVVHAALPLTCGTWRMHPSSPVEWHVYTFIATDWSGTPEQKEPQVNPFFGDAYDTKDSFYRPYAETVLDALSSWHQHYADVGVEATCTRCGLVQSLKLVGQTWGQALVFAGILDGTSPLYAKPVGPKVEGGIGCCATCRGRFYAKPYERVPRSTS